MAPDISSITSASINLEVSKQGGTERLFPFKISFIRKIMLSIKNKEIDDNYLILTIIFSSYIRRKTKH